MSTSIPKTLGKPYNFPKKCEKSLEASPGKNFEIFRQPSIWTDNRYFALSIDTRWSLGSRLCTLPSLCKPVQFYQCCAHSNILLLLSTYHESTHLSACKFPFGFHLHSSYCCPSGWCSHPQQAADLVPWSLPAHSEEWPWHQSPYFFTGWGDWPHGQLPNWRTGVGSPVVEVWNMTCWQSLFETVGISRHFWELPNSSSHRDFLPAFDPSWYLYL